MKVGVFLYLTLFFLFTLTRETGLINSIQSPTKNLISYDIRNKSNKEAICQIDKCKQIPSAAFRKYFGQSNFLQNYAPIKGYVESMDF